MLLNVSRFTLRFTLWCYVLAHVVWLLRYVSLRYALYLNAPLCCGRSTANTNEFLRICQEGR